MVVKDPNESNSRKEGVYLACHPRKVGWRQQALEGAGHRASALKKQKAVKAGFRALSLFSPFGQSRAAARECYRPQWARLPTSINAIKIIPTGIARDYSHVSLDCMESESNSN